MSIELKLTQWYKQSHRTLPFRLNQDPYRVWISEIMAQQTQIDTLIPYYERWMHEYPTLESLSHAPLEALLKRWEGLGYYSRVQNIHAAAHILQIKYQGYFPTALDDIRALPGIGPYTASAIASICFETKTAAIDGNVKRVMSRLFRWDESLLKTEFTQKITQTIETWMQSQQPSVLTQALMELGALVCNKQAKCELCPLSDDCQAFQTQQVHLYPYVKAKMAKKTEQIDVVLLINSQGEMALTLNHSDELMKGYYRLPTLHQLSSVSLNLKKESQLTHVFTHKVWEVTFYSSQTDQAVANVIWVKPSAINELPIITLHRKFLQSKTF